MARSCHTVQGQPKTDSFLGVDNFATVNGKKTYVICKILSKTVRFLGAPCECIARFVLLAKSADAVDCCI